MIKRVLLLISILIVFNIPELLSQEIDSIYGLNPVLYNGQIYSYINPLSIKGDQYINGSSYANGFVEIQNKKFENLNLNYDIYNQEILLKFDISHRTAIIKLDKSRLDKFGLDDKIFILLNNDNLDPIIYQSIGSGYSKILIHKQKTLFLSSNSGRSSYVFSKPFKTMYLLYSDQLKKFSNNRNFLSILNKEDYNNVKKYLKQSKTKIKRASDPELYKLINYLNTL